MQALAAAHLLRRCRVCAEKYEVGRVTHLVVGSDKRTLKLLLGVAEGAHLMSPAWVTDSLTAGQWLPEADYVAQVGGPAGQEARACPQCRLRRAVQS